MTGSFSPDGSTAIFWLTVFVVGLLCCIWSAASLFLKRLFRSATVRMTWCVVAILPTTLIVIHLFDLRPNFLSGVYVTMWKLSLLLLFFSVQMLLFSDARINTMGRASLRFSVTATIWMIAITGWSSHLFYTVMEPVPEVVLLPDPPPPMRETTDLVAYTDKDRPVRLLTPLDDAFRQDLALVQIEGFNDMLIMQAPPDFQSNCHGWVFTNGKFVVPGPEVEQILEDNGYDVVTEPRENDLIVYRNESGNILHTGIVRVAAPDGLVLIESKWGTLGRYLHHPKSQSYSHFFIYYRSSRDGHLLQFRRPTPASEITHPPLNQFAQRTNHKWPFAPIPQCQHLWHLPPPCFGAPGYSGNSHGFGPAGFAGTGYGFGAPRNAGSNHGFVWGRTRAASPFIGSGKKVNQPDPAKELPLHQSHDVKGTEALSSTFEM